MAALLGAASASAQSTGSAAPEKVTEASSDDPEIVVEAPPTDLERRRELREMAEEIIRPPRLGRTIGTFFDAICPKVFGLPEEPAAAIETRIRQNADRLGANRRDPRENCNHNISVVFVAPQKGPPSVWLNERSELLDHLLSYERARVLEETGPVRSWTYTAFRSADGNVLPEQMGRPLENVADFANPLRLESRLRSRTTNEIIGAMVLIELASAQGKTLEQLADYATMRTFAPTGGIAPDVVPAAPTILTLFQDEEPPEGLTVFDRALISKLYDSSRNALASRYFSDIGARALAMESEERSVSGE
ncbi:hypothetical protein ACI5KX_06650 [Erythrobacter sp. GH1-10]|uniref:hypothetical protein n=1 Tax=Erythrobacter sp. GH1-10 TaxID=3349334 RepID=UPI003877A2A1